MIYLAYYVAIGLVLTVALFVLYVFTMNIQRVNDLGKLTKLCYWLSVPFISIGLIIDFLLNQLYFSVICLDPFNVGTVTSRMKKYKYEDSTKWQKSVSSFVEMHIDAFEDKQNGHI